MMLLELGADTALRNREGRTPLELADTPCDGPLSGNSSRSRTEVAVCIRTALETQQLCGALQRLALAKTFSMDGASLADALPPDVLLTISET
eukprot:COSAG06_NODE_32042_length_512_cov_0.871671_1_plen_91_part_01